MAFLTAHFPSKSLAKQTAINVVLPDEGDGPFPVYYLLHGLSDDYTIWRRRTSIERYVDGMPLIVVMPDGGRGWYTNACQGFAYEDHILKDVMGFVERAFPARTGNERARVIGGNSMGGYGAVKLCFKYPELFAGVAAHSSVFQPGHQPPAGDHAVELERIFGPGTNPDEDAFALAERNKDKLPPIRFDCGVDDWLIDSNRELHAHLEKLGVEHDYKEFPGGHDWGYWDVHVQQALAFLASALDID